MSDDEIVELLRDYGRPMEPVATDIGPKRHQLPGIRAVLLDVYGTMLISGSGDIGTLATAPADAFAAACMAVGLRLSEPGERASQVLVDTIASQHRQARRSGVEHPEVDMIEIWRQTLETLRSRGSMVPGASLADVDLRRLAVEYEARVNPSWPMPGVAQSLQQLHAADCRLGIVSNAQFFTPLLIEAALGRSLEELGFLPPLCVYSFVHRQAKPDTYLYLQAQQALEEIGIAPRQVLYVGNDMLNDVLPAGRVGFRTGLFAGDGRSLRMRHGDARVAGIEPDVIFTHLDQIPRCVGLR